MDHARLRDRCQQIIAKDHADSQAIGIIGESGTTKSGNHTAGVKRQYNGNRGKVENSIVSVALSFATASFRSLLDACVYLPEEWANDPVRRKKTRIPDEVTFKTKPGIALDMVDRSIANGVSVMSWTFDELYGRDGKFLDGLDERNEAFVGEVPPNAHVWLSKPRVLKKTPKNRAGRPKNYPRLKRRDAKPSEVQNLRKYSPAFCEQRPQRYRIKDTLKGPKLWEIRWHTCWRKTHDCHLVSNQCTLIVARNVWGKSKQKGTSLMRRLFRGSQCSDPSSMSSPGTSM